MGVGPSSSLSVRIRDEYHHSLQQYDNDMTDANSNPTQWLDEKDENSKTVILLGASVSLKFSTVYIGL